MILRFSLLQKLDGMGTDAFDRHWRDVHAPLAIKLEGLMLYHLDMVRAGIGGEQLPLWPADGIALLGFSDLAAMKRAGSTAAGKADRHNFIKTQRTLVCQRGHVTGSPHPRTGAAKGVVFLTRRSGISEDAFTEAWAGEHARAAIPWRGAIGTAKNAVVDRWPEPWVSAPYPAMPIDAIEELWFDSEQALDAAFTPAALKVVEVDRAAFVQRSIYLKIEEHQVI